MARIRSRKSSRRHFTPLANPIHVGGHANTPQRSGVFFARAFAQELGILIPRSLVLKVTSVAERNQARILALNQVRTLHN
jgi:hypothetical protein